LYKISEINFIQIVRIIRGFSQTKMIPRKYIVYLCGISLLCLTTVEDLNPAARDYFNDFIPVTRKKMSTRMWEKIKVYSENGGQSTDNF
jgi:hypothetical protein